MCYAQEGHVQSSDTDSLSLEQLKTIFYSLFAIGVIGLTVGIGENAAKRLLNSRSSEALKNSSPSLELRSSEMFGRSSPSLEGKYPVLCHSCSSNVMLILNRMDSESGRILEQKMESGGTLELKWKPDL